MNFFRTLLLGYRLSTFGEAARELLLVFAVCVTQFIIEVYLQPILIESNSLRLSLINFGVQVALVASLVSAFLFFWLKGRYTDFSR